MNRFFARVKLTKSNTISDYDDLHQTVSDLGFLLGISAQTRLFGCKANLNMAARALSHTIWPSRVSQNCFHGTLIKKHKALSK